MADAKRNIVHVREGDDLVIHWEGGILLLSKSKFAGYETGGGSPPRIWFEGSSALREILPPEQTLEVAQLQAHDVQVAVDQLEAAEPPVL